MTTERPRGTAAGARLKRPSRVAGEFHGPGRALASAAAGALGIVLPLAMVVANKSAPVALALGALLACSAAVAAGRGPQLVARARILLSRAAGPVVIGSFAWAVVSLLWSVSPSMTLRGLRETAPELLFGGVLAAAWPVVARRSDLRLLGAGVVLAGALIAFERLAGMPLHHLAGTRAMDFDLKRSSIPPLLLMWPAIALRGRERHWGWVSGLVGFALLGSVVSHSSASVVAIAVGVLAYGLALRWPRRSVLAFAGILVLLLAAAPWTGTLMGRTVTPAVERLLEDQHAQQRVAIWRVFESRVWERPWLGHGFDTSFRLGDGAAGTARTADDAVIKDIHPHNQLLQVWIDFGAVGAVGVLVAIGLMARLRRAPRDDVAPRLAFLASAAVMGLVGVQAWDAWWLATLAVGWAAFTALRGLDAEPASA